MSNEKYATVYGIWDIQIQAWVRGIDGKFYQAASPGALMPYFLCDDFAGDRYVIDSIDFDGEPSGGSIRADKQTIVTGWFCSQHGDGVHRTWVEEPLSMTLSQMAGLIKNGIGCSFTPATAEEASHDGNS